MKTIAIFQSGMFALDAGSDVPAHTEPQPLGKDCAVYCADILMAQGVSLEGDPGEPIESNGDWFIYASLGRLKYEIVVFWLVPVRSREEYWGIRVRVLHPLLKRVFGRENQSEALSMINLLDKALCQEQGKGRIRGLHWISEGELGRMSLPDT